MLLFSALPWIYTPLGAFAAASLVMLLDAVSGQVGNEILMSVVIGAGLLLGFLGAGGLVGGCVNLLHATRLLLVNIRAEAAFIHAHQEQKKSTRRGIKALRNRFRPPVLERSLSQFGGLTRRCRIGSSTGF